MSAAFYNDPLTFENATGAPVSIPRFIPKEVVAKILRISELHVRLLVRDSRLKPEEIEGKKVFSTLDVLALREPAVKAQQEFAEDVASLEKLYHQATQSLVS
ncbi:hypothetical protein CPHO_01935 [Corynebacterium phocae]|uniref:Uncharacterized protein n=1 Tax=Corynebacterium phocae TaxID=161895 RepID=A0A1L7D155_9CORY|nr:hypothetical protein [Corynebacterium phocae]APT91869.1 hypothetical protein CPHO_01935 [Corynebacterium phocae]KAA8727415.1 hypothetical protein F4V58_01465 [Corynebacterium phocae]